MTIRNDVNLEIKSRNRFTGPWVVRGIAGSGKTVKLCQMAASAHALHPEWKIALVFHTRSLYGIIEKLLGVFCQANGEKWKNGEGNLNALHAWGSIGRTGLYKWIARENGIQPMSYDITKKDIGSDAETNGLPYACGCLLTEMAKKGPMAQIFDMILIDESQDLLASKNEYKFTDKEPFFWMAHCSLRPVDKDRLNKRRLIWAFDEYQCLNSRKIPKGKELFGNDVDFASILGGRGEIMPCCYRTPHEITIAAHAIGMGLYYRGGMLSGPTRREDWGSLGYNVTGEFRYGETIRIQRPPENSANNPSKLWGTSTIGYDFSATNRFEEMEMVSKDIRRLLDEEQVKPESILVVAPFRGVGFNEAFLALENQGIKTHQVSSTDQTRNQSEMQDDSFTVPNCVTLSGLNRAKGNEALIVYVIGLDVLARAPYDLSSRNSLYVAMTRTRGWLHLSGIRDGDGTGLYQEVSDCLKDLKETGGVQFTYRKAPSWNPSKDAAEDPAWQQKNLEDF